MNPVHGVNHYENFPVASILTPRRLRPAVIAIYRFARTADDLADEGDASASQRLTDLGAYRRDLSAVAGGQQPSSRWRGVFGPLAAVMHRHSLPTSLFEALLSAFEQDVTTTRYATRRDLLDYCARSANPVGRLLLHLYGVADEHALERSDAICTALQLINFWQDLSVDLRRGRIYLPLADCRRFDVDPAALLARRDSSATRALVADACCWARETMMHGAPLAGTLRGRLGWELRVVIQGGLRILEKISRLDHATMVQRPRLRVGDALPLLWRAALM